MGKLREKGCDLDRVITFRRLTMDQILKIVDLEVGRLQRRVDDRGITIELTEGARPLKRAEQQHLQNPLARRLLGDEFGEGGVVEIDAADGPSAGPRELFTFRRAG